MDMQWDISMDQLTRQKLYSDWKKAVTRSFDWLE